MEEQLENLQRQVHERQSAAQESEGSPSRRNPLSSGLDNRATNSIDGANVIGNADDQMIVTHAGSEMKPFRPPLAAVDINVQ